MPIYAYKCDSCGFAKDVLQKISEAPLTQCPSCGAPAFHKQVTAAGFQLKGSGWYVTDFRGGSNGAAPAGDKKADSASESKTEGAASDSKSEGKAESKPAETPAAKKPDPTPAAGS